MDSWTNYILCIDINVYPPVNTANGIDLHNANSGRWKNTAETEMEAWIKRNILGNSIVHTMDIIDGD